MKLSIRLKGGPGSGNAGHEGIPGHQGGSLPKDAVSQQPVNDKRKDIKTPVTEVLDTSKGVIDYLFEHRNTASLANLVQGFQFSEAYPETPKRKSVLAYYQAKLAALGAPVQPTTFVDKLVSNQPEPTRIAVRATVTDPTNGHELGQIATKIKSGAIDFHKGEFIQEGSNYYLTLSNGIKIGLVPHQSQNPSASGDITRTMSQVTLDMTLDYPGGGHVVENLIDQSIMGTPERTRAQVDVYNTAVKRMLKDRFGIDESTPKPIVATPKPRSIGKAQTIAGNSRNAREFANALETNKNTNLSDVRWTHVAQTYGQRPDDEHWEANAGKFKFRLYPNTDTTYGHLSSNSRLRDERKTRYSVSARLFIDGQGNDYSQVTLVNKVSRGESNRTDMQHHDNIVAVRKRLAKQFGIPEEEFKLALWTSES